MNNLQYKPKSIKIFLIDGEPDGLKTIELSNWVGQGIVIPRNKLKEVKDRQDCNKPSIYFLIGKRSEDSILPMVYVGEAEILWKRLSNHDDNKDFWQIVIAFTSKDSNLTKAHVKYLESRCLSIVNSVKRAEVENDAISSTPSLSEADIAEMEEFLENLQILVSALGYPFFQPITPKDSGNTSDPLFICAGKNVSASGRLINDGFIVYKNSTASLDRSKTAIDRDSHKHLVEKLIETGHLKENKDHFLFLKDYVFNSPTAAAEIILGHPASGWERWRMGKTTLKEFYNS